MKILLKRFFSLSGSANPAFVWRAKFFLLVIFGLGSIVSLVLGAWTVAWLMYWSGFAPAAGPAAFNAVELLAGAGAVILWARSRLFKRGLAWALRPVPPS